MVAELVPQWRALAETLRPYNGGAATALDRAATELEGALSEEASQSVTLTEGSAISGYSARRLREMVAAGTLANVGERGVTRVRRAELPRKVTSSNAYNPADDALSIVRRRTG